MCSMPIDRRTHPRRRRPSPARPARAGGAWSTPGGWPATCTSPMLTSRVNSCSASRKRAPRSRPSPAGALDAERQDAGGLAAHVLLHQRVVRVVRQPGVVDPGHLGVALQVLAILQRVVADAVHAQRQRLDALQDQEGVERRDRRARVAQRHHAGAADVGGRAQRFGVDDAVVAETSGSFRRLKRALCSAQGNLPRSTMAPPMLLPWPPRYLVSECTTMSAPCSNGRHR